MSAPSEHPPRPAAAAATLGEVVDSLRRRRLRLLIITVAAAVAAALFTLTLDDTYTASASLLPAEKEPDLGLLGQLAGLRMGAAGNASLEGVYGEIIRSDRILDALIARRWQAPSRGGDVDLYRVFGVAEETADGPPEPGRRALLRDHLRRDVVVFRRNRQNGYMVLQVEVPRDPTLAADLANGLVEMLERFTLDYNLGKASDQFQFITQRLDSVSVELARAESELVHFTEANRRYRDSPQLNQRYRVLQREVDASTGTWVELRRQAEVARIERNKRVDPVTVLDLAQPPVVPSGPNRGGIVAGVAMLALLAAALGVLAWDFWPRRPAAAA